MGRGILGTLGLAATLVFAIPVAMLGVDFLLKGRPALGTGFLFVAALMIAVEEYVTTPTDLPGMVAEKVVGRAVDPGADERE